MAAVEFYAGNIGVIHRREYDHLVAGTDAGRDGGVDGLGRPGRHRDLGFRIIGGEVKPRHLFGYGFAQRRHSGHGRVLVGAGRHVMADALQQARRGREVGKALRQVDRAVFRGKLRHHGKDRGADVRQTGRQVEAHGRFNQKILLAAVAA